MRSELRDCPINNENDADQSKAICEMLKMWLRLSKEKATEEATRAYIRRRRSRFAEPRIHKGAH
jgi:hypothetical protein